MKRYLVISLIIGLLAVSGGALFFLMNRQSNNKFYQVNFDGGEPTVGMCPQDARLCPDGSTVVREGLQCEFPACPGTASGNQAGIANPASINCRQQGGSLQIKDSPKGQYGLCYFDDNRACEEWALMRGDCPVGGVKTTGYDTEAQKYCAWSGGITSATVEAVCVFKDGSQCLTEDYYGGKCSPGVIDPTADWQIYTNDKHNLTFKYPKSWPKPTISSLAMTGGFPQIASEWRLAVGTIAKGACTKDCDGFYFSGFAARDYIKTIKELKANKSVSNISEKVVNGNKVIVFVESGMTENKNALIFGVNQMVELTDLASYSKDYDGSNFELILSSFKFIK